MFPLRRRRGQAQLLVLTLIVVLVLYIIFLPPDARQELLESGTIAASETAAPASVGPGGVISGSTEDDEYVFQGPGDINDVRRDEYKHTIPPQTIYVGQSADTVHEENDFTVTQSAFVDESHSFSFSVRDPSALENPVMSFIAPERSGRLRILLNGETIYNREVISERPIAVKLSSDILTTRNTIQFVTDPVGWAFWKKNQYVISELRVIADVIDFSRSQGSATFELRSEEIYYLERAKLRFVPECSGDEGVLKGFVNGQQIFATVPSCGIINVYTISTNFLKEGANTLHFQTERGSYDLDSIEITTELDDDNEVIYFFDLDEDLFSFTVEEEAVCGQIDGVCPLNCGEDVDKDCCFDNYEEAFWCDVPTTFRGDRCVGAVTSQNVLRCPSGYEDDNGDPDEDFEEYCGDDEDGICPAGCSKYYDKDCCFDQSGDQYFCEDLTITGLSDVCVNEVSEDMCGFCPEGYEGEDSDPDSCFENANPLFEDVELLDEYIAYAKFYFVDDGDQKEATITINSFATRIDTRDDFVQIDISRYVKDNSNYIEIDPDSDFNLIEVRVDIDIDRYNGKIPQRRDPDPYVR